MGLEMTTEGTNGSPEIALELSLSEAQGLKSWLLKSSADGAPAIEDESVKAALVKLGGSLDYIEGVATVRQELAAAGFETTLLSDAQVADLGRRIAESSLRRQSA
jgi:hypothetical protein